MNKQISSALFKMNNNSNPKIVKCSDLDRDTYRKKYRNRLYCINGCDAKMKFTPNSNGTNFFSTWPNEGHLHDLKCPYRVEHDGTEENNKSNGTEGIYTYTEDQIKQSFRTLDKLLSGVTTSSSDKKKDIKTNPIPKKSGSKSVPNLQYGGISDIQTPTNRKNITKLLSHLLDYHHIGLRKQLYGQIEKIEIVDVDSEFSVYMHLFNPNYKISLVLPPAFYLSPENNTSKAELIEFVSAIQNGLQNKQPLLAAGLGFVREKEDNWFCVEVLESISVTVNSLSYNAVRLNPSITNKDYPIFKDIYKIKENKA